jgi:hypothetical protein
MYERSVDALAGFAAALQPVERQAGAVFAINGFIVGLDLFDAPATWRKLLPELVQSYGLESGNRAALLSMQRRISRRCRELVLTGIAYEKQRRPIERMSIRLVGNHLAHRHPERRRLTGRVCSSLPRRVCGNVPRRVLGIG